MTNTEAMSALEKQRRRKAPFDPYRGDIRALRRDTSRDTASVQIAAAFALALLALVALAVFAAPLD